MAFQRAKVFVKILQIDIGARKFEQYILSPLSVTFFLRWSEM